MALTLVGASAAAQTSPSELQNSIMKMMEDPALSHAITGFSVRTVDGRILAEHNVDRLMMPASNMKLISFTRDVFHSLTSIDVSFEQSRNIPDKFITFDVSQLLKSPMYQVVALYPAA